MSFSRYHIRLGSQLLFRELKRFVTNPLFIVITILGNLILLMGAVGMYHLELETNSNLNSFFDAIYFSLMTVTTVGYGDIVPVTTAGRALTMVLNVVGTGLFLAYISLFSSAFINVELSELEREVELLRRKIR